MKIIGIDIDGTIADTGEWFANALSTTTGKKLAVSDVTGHDWVEEGICTLDQQSKVLEFFYESGCLDVPPIKDALNTINALIETYLIYFVTARPLSMRAHTKMWLEENRFPYNELILTGSHNKHELDIPFDVFVEDRYETALAMAEKGVWSFLLDSPWNRGKDTSHIFMERIYTWDEIAVALRRYSYAQSN